MNLNILLAGILSKVRNIGRKIVGISDLFTFKNSKSIVVTFTGGMGAQVISAAIYFLLRNEGRKVYADLSYFEQSSHVAVEGNPGDISHWDWQLQSFGLFPESFERLPKIHRSKYKLIQDGKEKSALGLKALGMASIQKYFLEEKSLEDILPQEFIPNYLCIHVRRGDYVNVASYLVDDVMFIELANKIAGLVSCVVIVSDSAINESFRKAICNVYQKAIFLDEVDAITAHRIMRNARVLICSNSQFSLIAALLNKRALVFLPKTWFGKGNAELEVPINELCSFQILRSK
jgi:hypothetical protein